MLSEPEFLSYSAGIVLQSYLPEAFIMQQKMTEWAVKRCKKGGAPIKIRIVKGANLAMEQVEASLKNCLKRLILQILCRCQFQTDADLWLPARAC